MGFGGMNSALKKWFSDVGEIDTGGDTTKPTKDTGKTAKKIADEYEKAIKKIRWGQK